MKNILIVSVNPDEACIIIEKSLIEELKKTNNVFSINLNKVLQHIHPDQKRLDYFYELIDRKYERFILKNINSSEIKISKKELKNNTLTIPLLPNSIDEIRKYKINNIGIGIAALSTAASYSKCTSEHISDYGTYLNQAWILAHKSYYVGCILNKHNFDQVYIFNGRHAISRPIAEVMKKKAKVIYYETNIERTAYLLSEDGFHDSELLAKKINEYKYDAEEGKLFYKKLYEGSINTEYEKIHKNFRLLEKDSKTINKAVIFYTSSPDEFFAIKDINEISEDFKNQFAIANYLCGLQKAYKFQLIVRLHPYLRFKHESWKEEWDFEYLKENRAIIIQPDEFIDSYDLLEYAKACVTVGSTIGIEAVYKGIPTIDIGKTIANQLGITEEGNTTYSLENFISSPYLMINSNEKCLQFGSYQLHKSTNLITLKSGAEMSKDEMIKIVSPVKFIAQKIKRVIKKNKYLEKLYTFIFYVYIRNKIKRKINEIDRNMPKKGVLSDTGYIFYENTLNKLNLNIFKEVDSHKSIILSERHSDFFNEIFQKILPICYDYLGSSIIIDSISVTSVNNQDAKSVSSNWHTDNVGSNLKIYVCIDGDGSLVTKYIAGSNKNKYKPNFLEDLRMIGFQQKKIINNEVAIRHKTGSLAIFDTNGLHRGAYEVGLGERKVLEIELANKDKAKCLVGYAPIGVRSGQNTFFFTDKFIDKFKYKNIIDVDRIKNYRRGEYIYGETPTHFPMDKMD